MQCAASAALWLPMVLSHQGYQLKSTSTPSRGTPYVSRCAAVLTRDSTCCAQLLLCVLWLQESFSDELNRGQYISKVSFETMTRLRLRQTQWGLSESHGQDCEKQYSLSWTAVYKALTICMGWPYFRTGLREGLNLWKDGQWEKSESVMSLVLALGGH